MQEEAAWMLEWSIPSRFGEEIAVMAQLKRQMLQQGEPADKIEDVLTCVSEACLNGVEHGNGHDVNLHVSIQMCVYPKRYLFRVCDHGAGMVAGASQPAGIKPPSEEGRGWGLLFMSRLADRVQYGRDNGRFCVELEFARSYKEGDHR